MSWTWTCLGCDALITGATEAECDTIADEHGDECFNSWGEYSASHIGKAADANQSRGE